MSRHQDPKGDHRYEERRRWFEHALRAGRDDALPEQFARHAVEREASPPSDLSRRTRIGSPRGRSHTESG